MGNYSKFFVAVLIFPAPELGGFYYWVKRKIPTAAFVFPLQ